MYESPLFCIIQTSLDLRRAAAQQVPVYLYENHQQVSMANQPDPYNLVGETVRHFQIEEVLGGGGMGVVYRAIDIRLQRSVALKFLPPALSHDVTAKERFLAEAQAASALDHANICTVHEFGESNSGQLFIAMAYYDGESLRTKFEGGTLPKDEAVDYAIQIAKGLSAAHDAGIVHRDIKPANIIATADGEIKIVDFGVARFGDAQLTQAGTTLGTTSYMSPEQTRGEDVDGRADVWALGVVLYEALTGTRPFKGSYDQAIVYSILHEEPRSLTEVNPKLTPELEAVVQRCLQKDPALRYPDAGSLLADLNAIRSGGSPEAPLQTSTPRPRIGLPKVVMAVLGLVGIVLAVLLFRQLGSDSVSENAGLIHAAVLPFTNVSGDSTDQAFIDGLGYTVSATLTEMEQFEDRLSVVPADVDGLESRSLSESAEALHADVLVTGSVQRADTRIRLTLNLYDAEQDRQLRSHILDNESADLLALQDSVALVLAELLDIELSASEEETLSAGGTSSSEAFDDYTRARGYLLNYENESNIDLAIQHFERAIEQDELYVLAYAGLGEACWRKFDASSDPQWMSRASESSERAIELNPNLSPVHVTAGLVFKGTGRYDEAEQEFVRALEIDSTNAFAHQQLAATYYLQSRFDDAESHYLRAIELKPNYWGFFSTLGYLYRNQGRNEEAARVYRRVIELRPDNPWGYGNLGAVYLNQNNLDSALIWFERQVEVDPDDPSAYTSLAGIQVRRRDFPAAIEMFERSVELDSTDSDLWYFLASAYNWNGDSTLAASAWQKVIEIDSRGLEVNPSDSNALIGVAFASVMTGEEERGRLMLERLEHAPTKVAWIQQVMAEIAEQLGERDRALGFLGEGFEIGLAHSDVEASPWLDDLRDDPQYQTPQ